MLDCDGGCDCKRKPEQRGEEAEDIQHQVKLFRCFLSKRSLKIRNVEEPRKGRQPTKRMKEGTKKPRKQE